MTDISPRVIAAREPLARLLLVAAIALPVGCVLGAVVLALGVGASAPVVAGRAPAAARFLVLYAAPLLLVAPLWVRARLRCFEHLSAPVRGLDAAVLALSLARFVIGSLLPFSGHMLFLVYSGLVTRGVRGYRVLAIVLLVETTIWKLAVWRDVRSWALGLILGLVATAMAVRMTPGSTPNGRLVDAR